MEVYNEALLVFLFDESHLKDILESGADLATGYADKDADVDKGLKTLAKNGILQAYELAQDECRDTNAVEILRGLNSFVIGGMHRIPAAGTNHNGCTVGVFPCRLNPDARFVCVGITHRLRCSIGPQQAEYGRMKTVVSK